MKCIVTAGPAYEELDEVRRLTNFSTGSLGTELANFLVAHGHDVVLLRGHYSTCQIDSNAQRTQIFTTSADLRERLRRLRSRTPDAIFHAAAVSDFKFGRFWSRAKGGELKVIRSAKFSAHGAPLLAELVPAPKIISDLRNWFPMSQLVGWKYELEGTRAQAVAKAARQLVDNKTNACVVNGRAYGAGFGLLTDRSKCRHFPGRTALFHALSKFITPRSIGPEMSEIFSCPSSRS